MKKNITQSSFLSIALLTSSLILLSGFDGCNWFKHRDCPECPTRDDIVEPQALVDKELASKALITMDGKPAMTITEFNEFVETVKKSDPQAKMAFELGPEIRCQLYTNLATYLESEQAFVRFVQENKLADTPTMKEKAKIAHDRLDKQLALEAFSEHVKGQVKVDDAEAKKLFEENKSRLQYPPYLKSLGGMKTQVIEAKSDDEAKKIKTALEKPGADINKVAKDMNKKIEDLGVVNEQSKADQNIKNVILMKKSAPAVDTVKSDGKIFVVYASKKVEPEIASYEEVKDIFKEEMVKPAKANEAMLQKLEDLKKQYKITVDKELINKMCGVTPKPMPAPMAAPEAAPVPKPAIAEPKNVA